MGKIPDAVYFYIVFATAVLVLLGKVWKPFGKYKEKIDDSSKRIENIEKIQAEAIGIRQDLLLKHAELVDRIGQMEKWKTQMEMLRDFRETQLRTLREEIEDLEELYHSMDKQISKISP